MASKGAFQQIMADFIGRPLPDLFPRELDVPEDVPKIISLLGHRRTGKTYHLFAIIQRLRESLPHHRMVYINFEDDRLFPTTAKDMDGMLQGYYEMYPNNRGKKVWFFFDEIQEVADWEKFIRRLSDNENCRIYLTGSSAKLLSRELASGMRGRTLPYEVFPLNFSEFLRFNEIVADPITSQGKALILHWLRRYLKQGGFPELVFLPDHLHRRTINEYIDLMLYRDIADRFALKNTHLLKYLLKFLISNLARPVSLRKIYRDLRSQGLAISLNTVHEYCAYLEEAYAIFRLNIWSRSVRKQASNPSKFYVLDPAYKEAMSHSKDVGRVFENAAFLALRRKGYDLHYFLDRQEVDFFWDGGQLINLSYSIDQPETLEREIEGLTKAMAVLDYPESHLVTWDEERDLDIDGKRIIVRPLWKFLLTT